MAEMRDLDVGDRDADDLASLAADHLAVRDVLAQVLAHLPAHDPFEALEVAVDAAGHVANLAWFNGSHGR